MKRLQLLLFTLLALPIGMLAQTTWQSAIAINQGSTGSYTFDGTSDNAWFKIEVPEEGRVLITQTLSGELEMKWLDFCWPIPGDYKVRSSKWWMKNNETYELTDVGKGTYYLHICKNKGGGTCTLKYDFIPCAYANDAEPNDDYGQGTEISVGQTLQGRIGYLDANDYRDNYDCYKFSVPQDGRVQLITTCQSDYELGFKWMDVCYTKDGKDYSVRSTKWWMKNDTLTIDDAGVGTYYIKLMRNEGHGGYTLKYVFTPNRYGNDSEPNDKPGQGDEIAIGQTVQGHIGYLDANDYRDNDDCYKIVVPRDGRVQLITTCQSDYELQFKWMDVCYTKNSQDYPNRNTKWWMKNDTLTIDDAGEGTYYLHLNRNKGHGGYTLKYLLTPNKYSNDMEPNEKVEQVTQMIDINQTVTGHLGYLYGDDKRDNEDWIKLKTNPETTLMSISIEPDTTSTLELKWVDIVCVKGNEQKVVTNKWWIKSLETLLVDEVDADAEYYIHLCRDKGQGGYSVTYGTLERSLDSKIRVHYIGQNSTRLGIPSPFQIKVENLDSRPTGSFFLVVPVSDDVKLLYAECPCDTGIVRYSIEDMSDEAQNCAALYVSNLDPFESYTLTMYAEGRVDGKQVRSNRIVFSGTVIAVGAFVGSVAVGLIVDRGIRYYQDKYHDYVVKEGIEDKYMRSLSLTKDQLLDQKEEYNLPVECVKGVTKKIGENVMKTVPGGGTVATFMGNVENVKGVSSDARRHAVTLWGRQGAIDDISDYMEGRGEYADFKVGATKKVKSWDPNEMCGPVGYGDEGFISETRTMDYVIRFENKKEATAPAYRIRITDILDESVFDVNTVRFGSSSHEGLQYNWKISREGNKLFWDIEGIELPPNVNAPEGEGFVTFSVDLKPGLKSGTQIKNKATIIFDYNEPIETNEYLNTLDLNAPTGRVQAVTVNDNKITINCTGEDSESGIGYYKYYYSLNGGDFQILTESSSPEMTFPMEEGRSASDYTFCVVAIDNVGNSQLTLSEPYAVGTSISNREVGPCNDTWTITRLDGQVVASGKGTPSARLATGGVYIIRQGNTARKVILK